MSTFFNALGGFRRTFGTTMNSSIQQALFYAKARKYASTLEASLDRSNIPVSVYTRLIDGVEPPPADLPSLSAAAQADDRDFRRSALLRSLRAAGRVGESALHARRGAAARRGRHALRWGATTCRCCSGRSPNDGSTGIRQKASGRAPTRTAAPTTCIPTSCSTTSGSTTTSARWRTSSGTRCTATTRTGRSRIATADYSTFVAEVASTFNEALLIDYMLKQIKDKPTRLSLLGSYLENIKATVFRQTQFAEFELRMHEMGLKGEPITGDALAKLYFDITTRYYGHEQKHRRRRRLRRQRVELHPALLPRLLRLPVRHVVHRGRSARRAA